MLELQNKALHRSLNWILIFVAGILLVSFTCRDLLWTTRHGINFWDILFNGRILHFYQDNIIPSSGNLYNGTTEDPCVYNFLIYIVFAVWDFPLWLLEKFIAVDVMNNFFCILYMKMLPVCSTLLCAKIMGKILKESGVAKERIKFTQYLFLSSTVILTNVLILCRYDSLCPIFMLLSLLYYLRKDLRKFLIYGGISFCFNFISFAMFLPLLLLREKNFRKLIKCFLFMLLPYILTTVPFLFGKTALSYGGKMIFNAISMFFSKTNGIFSWATIFYAAILLYSFLTDKEKVEDKNFVFWLSFVSVTSVFAFCAPTTYWMTISVPFIELVVGFADIKKYKLYTVIEFVGMSGAICAQILGKGSDNVYGGDAFKSMLMFFIMPDRVFSEGIVLRLWRKLFDTTVAKTSIPVFFESFFVASVLLLAFLSLPAFDKITQKLNYDSSGNKLSDVLIIRFVVIAIICFFPFVTLII